MNMYEYICNNEDIELFFQDFQFKERVFWKNLYEMYATEFIVAINAILTAMKNLKGNEIHELKMFI